MIKIYEQNMPMTDHYIVLAIKYLYNKLNNKYKQ